MLGLEGALPDDVRRNVAAPLHHSDDGSLFGAPPALVLWTFAATFTAAAFARLAADVAFIHFDHAAQQFPLFTFGHRVADLHTHPPAGALVHVEIPRQLAG